MTEAVGLNPKSSSASLLRRRLETLFVIFLVVSQVYYGYRYIFKYDSTGTSPTYANTPFLFKAAKYGITLGFILASALLVAIHRGRTRAISRSTLYFLLWITGFFAYSCAFGLTYLQGHHALEHDLVFRGLFFFPLLVFLPFHFRGWISARRYFAAVIVFGCIYHVSYSVIQILAFKLFGRLPALGYPGGLVRFGGGWDDPNGFGAYLILPLLFTISDGFTAGIKRAAQFTVLLTLLVLSVSLSAAAALCASIFVYAALRGKIKWLFAFLVIVGVAVLDPTTRDLMLFAYREKQASIESHLTTMTVSDFLQHASLQALLFGRHAGQASANESYYVAMLKNYGCLGFFWFISILVLTVINAAIKARIYGARGDYREAEVFRVLAAFLVSLSVAATGIAYYYIFPINLYLWLSIFVVWLIPSADSLSVTDKTMPEEFSASSNTEIFNDTPSILRNEGSG